MKEKTKFKQTEIGLIPDDWDIKYFGELIINHIKHGIYKSPEYFNLNGVKLLKMGVQYSTNRIGNQDMEKVIVTKEELNKFQLNEGDLVFSRTSMMTEGAGKCSIVINHNTPMVFDGNLLCANLNKKLIFPEFVFYFFNSELAQYEIKKITTGTQSRNISGSNLAKIRISFPPLPEQKAIAKILSDLDSKIELNKKMNSTLEEIGKTLFKRWFVDFEFPNEKGKPYKSSGGEMVYNKELNKEIPKESQVIYLKDILIFERGDEPGSKMYENNKTDDNIRFIRVSDLNNDVAKIFIPKKLVNTKCTFDNVLLSLDASVGIVKIGYEGSYSSGIRKVYAKDNFLSNALIYFLLQSEDIQNIINQYAIGTTILHANKAIEYMTFIIPSNKTINDFQKLINPIFMKLVDNIQENKNLADTRDLLLPKLMSGKIRVKY